MGIFPFKQLMYRWQKLSQSSCTLSRGKKALSTAGPEISTIRGHYEQRQENNREIAAMQMILQRPTQQVHRQK